jgi:small subunit ribosomal protein S16
MDARKRRDGAAIEEVGWYNPTAKDEMYSLKEDRILHWLQEGAQPTDTAHDILRTAGLAHKWHLMKQGLDEADVEKEMKKWALEREDVLKRRHQRAEAKIAEKKAAAGKKTAQTAAEADKPAEPDAKTEPVAEAAPVDEAPDAPADADTEVSAKEAPAETDDEAPAKKADDSDAEADESKEDSAAEDENVQEDKGTDEIESEKDKSGKKGSKKTAKKNGQETDDK